MTRPIWFLPLSESLKMQLERGSAPNATKLSRYEVAALLFILKLSSLAAGKIPAAIDLERKFASFLDVPSDQLRMALADAFNHADFITGLARATNLQIGLVDKDTISKHSFIRPDGTWDYDFAQRHRSVYGEIRHDHIRPSGVIIRLSDHQQRLVQNIRANQNDSIEAQAHAGTGKTFVLEEIMEIMPKRKFIFLADVTPKLTAIRNRFPPERIRTYTFKSLAEYVLSKGNAALQDKLIRESRLQLSYSGLAEQIGLSAIGNRSAAQVAELCWATIFKFCLSSASYINTHHIPRERVRWLSAHDQEIIAAAASKLWYQMTHLDLDAPSLPIRGYHRIKQMALGKLYIPEEYNTILIDEGHDLSVPMVELLDISPQTVITLGDQFQNLEGRYVSHKATIRHREMATSLRAGVELASYVNSLIEIFPGATAHPFIADRAKEMSVEAYPANYFPPEPSVIVVADNWGIFDWLIRGSTTRQGVAVVDWNKSFESFIYDCHRFFLRGDRPTNGALMKYRTWDQLHEDLKWNDSFLRVEGWLRTEGTKFGVSGLYKYANPAEFANFAPVRSLIADVFSVKNHEFPLMTISEDLYYSPEIKGKRDLSKKLATLYTAITRASGKLYVPDTHYQWIKFLNDCASTLR